jgi:hypothetical protein
MLIKGEKYACDACVRGHRVSSCQHQGKQPPKPIDTTFTAPCERPVSLQYPAMLAHQLRRLADTFQRTLGTIEFRADKFVFWADRPLVHINKKGRPVSQCPHCRGLRKARAQHVKCDCAEKAHSKDECPHENGEGKSEPLLGSELVFEIFAHAQ